VVSGVSVINVPPYPSLDVAKLPAMYWLRRARSGDEFVTPDASVDVSVSVSVKLSLVGSVSGTPAGGATVTMLAIVPVGRP